MTGPEARIPLPVGLEPSEPVGETLERRARDTPDRVALTWDGERCTFDELSSRRAGVRSGLAASGLSSGDRIGLATSDGRDFLATFLACGDLEVTPIPLPARAGTERLEHSCRRFGASALILDRPPPEGALSSEERTRRLVFSELPSGRDPGAKIPDPTATAFVQPTSGSTGEPKGVVIPHGALAANISQMVAGFGLEADDVFFGWLPLHHDMGLVFQTLTPLALGACLVLRPPGGRSLREWTHRLAEAGATVTAGPDFAYRLALRWTRPDDRPDLSRLRLALDAAEPVRASTVEEFERRFGLDRVLVPAYGLAEATVGVAAARTGAPLVVGDDGAVSVGLAFPGVRIGIVDPTTGREAGRSRHGEIVLRSPAVCDGYLDDEAASRRLFDGGFLHTGDLGRLDSEGRLFVLDRIKDVLLVGGETLAPRELEEIAEATSGVRRADAVGVDRGGLEGEQAVLVAEVEPRRLSDDDDLTGLATRLAAGLRAGLGFRPGTVLLVRTGTLPRTANGKRRRSLLRDSIVDGSLARDGTILWPRTQRAEGGSAGVSGP